MNETGRPGPRLPRDCRLHPLRTLPDLRGDLTEMFREEWFESPPPRLWHVMRGRADALTGMHVHARNWLYLCLLDGEMHVNLIDVRPGPGDQAKTVQLTLSESSRQALVIAPGIAHGLHFPQAARYLVGRVEEADPAEHLLCAWDSAEAGESSFAEFKAEFANILKRHDRA